MTSPVRSNHLDTKTNEVAPGKSHYAGQRTAPLNGDSADLLGGTEFAVLALLFLLMPLANIIVGHVAYHHWRKRSPAKAKAVNDLSIGCFLLQGHSHRPVPDRTRGDE